MSSERLQSTFRSLSYKPAQVELMLRLQTEGIPYLSEYQIETNLVRNNGFAKSFVADILIDGKIVIEVDGTIHNRATRARKDEIKNRWLTEHGYHVMRFTNTRIKRDLTKVVEEIREARSRLMLR